MAKEASTYGRTRDIPGDALALRLKYKLKRSSKCKYVEYFIFLFVVPALGAKTKMPFHVSYGFHGLAEKYTEQIDDNLFKVLGSVEVLMTHSQGFARLKVF